MNDYMIIKTSKRYERKLDIRLKNQSRMFESNYFQQMLKILVGDRKFYIWSACHKSDWIWKVCKDIGIKISGYIDSEASMIRHFQGVEVFEPVHILKCRNCFIFVALENKYLDVVDALRRYGLEEMRDYLYPGGNEITLIESRRKFVDFYGNEIRGAINGFKVKVVGGV